MFVFFTSEAWKVKVKEAHFFSLFFKKCFVFLLDSSSEVADREQEESDGDNTKQKSLAGIKAGTEKNDGS